MNVLFMGPNLAAGGAETQWSILLPGLRRRGFDARLIALDGGGPLLEPIRSSGVPVDVLSMRHQADYRALLGSSLLRHFVPDVVVTRGVSGLYLGEAVSILRRAAHVYNEHRQVGMQLSPRREAMVRLIARRLDRVIAVSAAQIDAWTARGYPRERIVVVENGVRSRSADSNRGATRRSLGVADSTVLAVLVASLRPEKRAADFVHALARAREVVPELSGIIVGDGPERARVAALADRLGGVRLLGYRDDVSRLLEAADIFVLCSEYEAVPIAILEAMAAGLPVLATRVGAIPAVVADGRSGYLVAAGDVESLSQRLTELASSAAQRRRMGAAGLERQREHWDAETMIDGYVSALGDVRP